MHTAPRSGATNLYLSGQFSLKTIADLVGMGGPEEYTGVFAMVEFG